MNDYLIAACGLAGGKNCDEVLIGENIVTGPARVNVDRETDILRVLRERGLVSYDAVGTGVVTITTAGKRYCEHHTVPTGNEGVDRGNEIDG